MSAIALLTPDAAARAKELEFSARTRVEGFLKNANRSLLKGTSSEFRQHRPYMAGDDLRNLDWRIYARSDRLVTREYDEYTNLDAILVVDASGSMGYGSGEQSKIQFVRHCAAMLAYLLHLQNDRVGLAVIADAVLSFRKPGSGRRHLAELYAALSSIEPSGLTDLAPCISPLAGQIRRRSVFVVFSDCYQDPEQLCRALGVLATQGHDVLLYQIHDPAETELSFPGFTLFRDVESGQVDAIDPLQIASAYREVYLRHQQDLRNGCARQRVEFHALTTTAAWEPLMSRLLRQRAGSR